tara:strand:- start:3664 stop:4062 length:399 start_codon:yes stop_codon:yes gene_type:complete
MNDFIGVGEKTAVDILHDILPKKSEIKIQYPLISLLSDDFIDSLDDRYLKHRIDIIVFKAYIKPVIVRVQGKDHEGVVKSSRDVVQKKIMEWNGCTVVDLNWYDCPCLFKEEKNECSINEIKTAFIDSNLLI